MEFYSRCRWKLIKLNIRSCIEQFSRPENWQPTRLLQAHRPFEISYQSWRRFNTSCEGKFLPRSRNLPPSLFESRISNSTTNTRSTPQKRTQLSSEHHTCQYLMIVRHVNCCCWGLPWGLIGKVIHRQSHKYRASIHESESSWVWLWRPVTTTQASDGYIGIFAYGFSRSQASESGFAHPRAFIA